MALTKPSRLAYIDWMRGFACIFMFQTHCYDAWLGGDARHSQLIEWSQRGGTLPAPLFLSLAGVGFAFITSKLRAEGLSAAQTFRFTLKRGAEIFAIGLSFRLFEFALGLGWAPWTDLFRVDVLNMIGLSMMAMAVMNFAAAKIANLIRGWAPSANRPQSAVGVGSDAQLSRLRTVSAWMALATALSISALAPMMWTLWRPRWLPWELETYINGVHIYDKPQPWLFPMFPWMGLAFIGLAGGFVIGSDWAKRNEVRLANIAGALGVALFFGTEYLVRGLSALGFQVYPTESYDFWHTSVDFFVIRVGLLLMVLWIGFAWCRWGWGARPLLPGKLGERLAVRPLISLGQNSLMVYWVHIEMVYGLFTILKPRAATISQATMGLFVIFVAMLVMTKARFAMRGRWKEVPTWVGLGITA